MIQLRQQRGGALVWLVMIAAGLLVFSCIGSQSQKQEQARTAQLAQTEAEQRAQQARAHRDQQWAAESEKILAEAEALLAAKKPNEAIDRIGPYIGIKNVHLESLHHRALVALNHQKLANVRPDAYSERADIYRTLARLEPDNRRHATQVEAMEKKAAAKIKAEKKRQGVSIGMTKQDVIDSSWGRPQHVNLSRYAWGDHEQWVYGGGQYLYFENGILTAIQARD